MPFGFGSYKNFAPPQGVPQIAPPSVTPPNLSEPLPALRPVAAPRPGMLPATSIAGAFGGPMPNVGGGLFSKVSGMLPGVASAVGQQFLSGMEERRNRLRNLAASGPGIQTYQPGFSPFQPGGINFASLLGGRNG